MLYCGDNALWAVPLINPPSHNSLLCPTEKLKGTFVWPQLCVPLLDCPVVIASSKLEQTVNVRRPQQWLLHRHTTMNPSWIQAFPYCRGRYSHFLWLSSDSILCRSSGDVRRRSLRLYWMSARTCRTDVLFGLPLRGLSATDPVSPRRFLMPYTVFTFTFRCRLTSRQLTPISTSTTALVRNSVLVFL